MTPAIDLTVEAWLAAAAVAGLAGMDDASWPQVMVSRPVVAGCVGGWILGDASAGLAAGAVLELLLLRHIPFGGARCPDPGPAGLVAGAAAAGATGPAVGVTAAAAAVGWAVGWLGEVSVGLRRRLAGWLVGDAEKLSRSPRGLERRHRLLTALDFVRGAALGAAFLVPAVAAVRVAVPPGASPAAPLILAVGVALAAGAGAGSIASSRRAAILVAAGGLAGLVVVGVLA